MGALLILTIGAQISDRFRRALSRRVVLNVVPSWRFFGPVPSILDMHLFFRTQFADGRQGRWQEIPIPPQGRWRAVWNPSRLEDKALNDLGNAVSAGSHTLRRRTTDPMKVQQAIQVSQPYLALLCWIDDYAGSTSDLQFRQFALIGSGADHRAESSVLFVSQLHRVALTG
jgi:hypothetical protein